ncbi:MAG: prephenate dehydrogenase [Thermoflexibacter sp.]|jgi:prephenate dehydrogenase|nr:prephenate dehydrogenase [Thermoflexibacter sp.]
MKICIIGLGLLGGSFSLGLKEKIKEIHVIGVDVNPLHVEKALQLGLIDEATPLEEGIKKSSLTVLATPVDIISQQINKVLDILPETSVLTDLGSTKEQICKIADQHSKRNQYVAVHPIAGTENSGPEAAFADLLKNKIMIICDKEKSSPQALMIVELLSNILEMRIRYMPSDEHDRHLAYVSHLSHISSFALGATVLDKEQDEQSIFDMAGSGFSSTVRLAKSSPQMWSPIFVQNKQNISTALGSYIQKLQYFKEIIDREDAPATQALMTQANDIRRVLSGIEKGK